MDAYLAIQEFYGERCAERSGAPLIQHIDEGLVVLHILNADWITRQAWCLHPLVQADEDLEKHYPWLHLFDVNAVALAMEYRSVANAYLSDKVIDDDGPVWPGPWPKLSPLHGVNQMLIADKVQNRADFELHHAKTHPRREELALYFQVWLEVLGITEQHYQALVLKMKLAKFTGR